MMNLSKQIKTLIKLIHSNAHSEKKYVSAWQEKEEIGVKTIHAVRSVGVLMIDHNRKIKSHQRFLLSYV